VTRMVSLMARPSAIYNKCYVRAAVADNLAETEHCRSAMNSPIQRVASHLIQMVVESGADSPLNTERYQALPHPETVSIYKGCSLACAGHRSLTYDNPKAPPGLTR
jgi:hypothetical protein